MKAVLARNFAPLDALQLADVPAPPLREGEVRIDVHACGINFMDGLIVQGKYQLKPPLPFSPGAEVSGVVNEVGAGVSGLAPGTRVLAFTGYGGYAQQIVAAAWRVIPLPASMDFTTAAAVPIAYGTSYHALKDRAALRAGETLLVLGAAGGVGLTAVELGKLMGARVIACASDDAKLRLCREYGAEVTINYAAQDLRAAIREHTGGRGVDVAYDPVGGASAEPVVRSMAFGGRYLVVGFASGEIPKIPLNLLLLKVSSLVGVFWGAWAAAQPAHNAANFAELLAWYEAGRLRPHVGASYPLERFRDALDEVMNRRARGKVVLTVR
ncbi:MAG: NADPH:quinone oxidoreductase family protein [Proteobacteria bacterium]|nr:NADPH:quinone oxidoreductase family protein [Pseudomonadota bacterium]